MRIRHGGIIVATAGLLTLFIILTASFLHKGRSEPTGGTGHPLSDNCRIVAQAGSCWFPATPQPGETTAAKVFDELNRQLRSSSPP